MDSVPEELREVRPRLIVPASKDSLLPSMKDLNWPIRRMVDVMVEFDRDELHCIMTSVPKRWDMTSTAGATARVSIHCITSSMLAV